MRITFVLPHAGIAGGIRVVAIYAERLQQRGHMVCVVSTPWIPPGRRGKLWAVIRRVLHGLNPFARGPLDPSHFDGLPVDHRRIKVVRPVTDDDVPDADVVVATWWDTAQWVADLSPSKGAKAYFIQDYGAHEGQAMDVVADTWRLPLHKITISQWLATLIQDHTGDADFNLVPNGVDREMFHAPARGKQAHPTVGFVYSRAPQKGTDVILRAIEQAGNHVPNLKVVAYGPERPGGDLPLPKGAQYWKCAENKELKTIYGSCDMWLFGSRSEGFGLPILEAMACRTPVIATPAGAAPELIAEGGGIMDNPDDSESMAKAIVHIAELVEPKWKQMSDAAHATAARYTWEIATDLFEQALEKAVKKARLH